MLAIDLHLDLAYNAIDWRRDLERSVAEIRAAEHGMAGKGRAAGTVAFPEMRCGGVAVASATLLARVEAPGNPLWGYPSQEVACAVARGQLAYYQLLAQQGKVRLLTDAGSLRRHLQDWQQGDPAAAAPPLGLMLSMEGADPILSPDQLPEWWQAGLRIVSLAHYGVSTYAHGTGTAGGLTASGRALLPALERMGMILDLTHLSDESFLEALDRFGGPVLASHSNCRALCPGDRQLSDEQIGRLVERDGIIGAALDAWMIQPGWVIGETSNRDCRLQHWIEHIDHVCQLAGNALHSAIGSDLDGGFGREQCPHDLDTIADLQRVPDLLRARGYREEEIASIMHGNGLRVLERAWGNPG